MTDDPTRDVDVPEEEETGPDSFLGALATALHPAVLAKAGDELAELVAAVHEHRKKGELTLKVTLSPMKNLPDTVEAATSIKVTPPRPELPGKVLWPTSGGRLETSDPRQMTIRDIRAVNDPREEGVQ